MREGEICFSTIHTPSYEASNAKNGGKYNRRNWEQKVQDARIRVKEIGEKGANAISNSELRD